MDSILDKFRWKRVVPDTGAVIVTVAWMLLAILGAARAQEGEEVVFPDVEKWLAPGCPFRLTFEPPEQAGVFVLVSVPIGVTDAAPANMAVFDSNKNPVSFRILQSESDQTLLLVTHGPSQEQAYQVYYGGTDGGQEPMPALADPLPVAASFFRSGSQGIPNTWAKMRYMAGREAEPALLQHLQDFGVITPDTGARGREGRWRGRRDGDPGRNPIIVLQTYFLCPESGAYRFAVDSRDAAYVLVDGSLIAQRTTEGEPGEWYRGNSFYLTKGVHCLEVYHKSGSQPYVRIGIQMPDSDSIGVLPHRLLLGSSMALKTLVDSRDRHEHADFTYNVRSAYTFRDCDVVFIPVDFTARFGDPAREKDVLRWDFGDGHSATGRVLRHVYKAPGRYRVSLESAGTGGAVRGAEAYVDCRVVRPQARAFEARVASLPAVCYATDRIEPTLLIEGEAPANVSLDVDCHYGLAGQPAGRVAQSVRLDGQQLQLPILSGQAGSVTGIAWTISHEGVLLRDETVRFLRAPGETSVAEVRGEALYDAQGGRVVVVPYRYAGEFTQPAIPRASLGGVLLCVDDSLATPTFYDRSHETIYYRRMTHVLDGGDQLVATHATLPEWCEESEAYGPLVRLVQVPRLARTADIVVVSVGLQDILWGTGAERFERHLAALTDLLAAGAGKFVVLSTPPPYPTVSADVRAFAAAVHRVAQARNIPVADLYSAFMSAGPERHSLFIDNDDFALSAQGHYLVGRVMARALLMHAEGE